MSGEKWVVRSETTEARPTVGACSAGWGRTLGRLQPKVGRGGCSPRKGSGSGVAHLRVLEGWPLIVHHRPLVVLLRDLLRLPRRRVRRAVVRSLVLAALAALELPEQCGVGGREAAVGEGWPLVIALGVALVELLLHLRLRTRLEVGIGVLLPGLRVGGGHLVQERLGVGQLELVGAERAPHAPRQRTR